MLSANIHKSGDRSCCHPQSVYCDLSIIDLYRMKYTFWIFLDQLTLALLGMPGWAIAIRIQHGDGRG